MSNEKKFVGGMLLLFTTIFVLGIAATVDAHVESRMRDCEKRGGDPLKYSPTTVLCFAKGALMPEAK